MEYAAGRGLYLAVILSGAGRRLKSHPRPGGSSGCVRLNDFAMSCPACRPSEGYFPLAMWLLPAHVRYEGYCCHRAPASALGRTGAIMRTLLVLSLICLAGCQGVQGPLAPRTAQRVDDPILTIGEQEQRTRARLALPDATFTGGPSASLTPQGARW